MTESYSPQEYVKSANPHMAMVTTKNENLFIITKVCINTTISSSNDYKMNSREIVYSKLIQTQ